MLNIESHTFRRRVSTCISGMILFQTRNKQYLTHHFSFLFAYTKRSNRNGII